MSFVEKGKSKKKTSIARKVYEQYKDDFDNCDAQKLKDDIKNIIDKLKIDKCSIDELDLRLETIFLKSTARISLSTVLLKEKDWRNLFRI